MKLLAVLEVGYQPDFLNNISFATHLVCYYGSAGCSCIGCNLHGALVYISERVENWFYELTTTPPSNIHPTIVVPVLVAFGSGTPLACKATLRL